MENWSQYLRDDITSLSLAQKTLSQQTSSTAQGRKESYMKIGVSISGQKAESRIQSRNHPSLHFVLKDGNMSILTN